MAGLFRLWHDKHNPPPDPKHISFHGKTVLVTGATSGLGFEAAIKFLQQDVSSLIITSRKVHDRGQATKARLEQLTGRYHVVQVWPLDMSSFDSVAEFASRINREIARLDVAILNAGVMHRDYILSQDGWEDTLQVNTLSTALLALLLLPKLRETSSYLLQQQQQQQQQSPYLPSREEASTPHLVIVSSGTAVRLTSKEILPPSPSRAPLLSYLNMFSTNPTPRKRYAISKLLLEYVARSIAKQQLATTNNDNGSIDVIVTTVKPGLCVSALGREYTTGSTNWVGRWAIALFNVLFARSAEVGSRVLVGASVQGYEAHGRMWKGDGYFDETGTLLRGEVGKRLHDKAWDEIVHVLKEKVPQLRDTISF